MHLPVTLPSALVAYHTSFTFFFEDFLSLSVFVYPIYHYHLLPFFFAFPLRVTCVKAEKDSMYLAYLVLWENLYVTLTVVDGQGWLDIQNLRGKKCSLEKTESILTALMPQILKHFLFI